MCGFRNYARDGAHIMRLVPANSFSATHTHTHRHKQTPTLVTSYVLVAIVRPLGDSADDGLGFTWRSSAPTRRQVAPRERCLCDALVGAVVHQVDDCAPSQVRATVCSGGSGRVSYCVALGGGSENTSDDFNLAQCEFVRSARRAAFSGRRK